MFFLLDCLKGWIAVKLCDYVFNNLTNTSESFSALLVLSGMLATLGYIYPIFVGFKGGKGVATLLGVILALTFYSSINSICHFHHCFNRLSLCFTFFNISFHFLCNNECFSFRRKSTNHKNFFGMYTYLIDLHTQK